MAQSLIPASVLAPTPSRLRRWFEKLAARLPRKMELRLLALERVLRSPNFVLIHEIERFEGSTIDGETAPSTRWAATYRTDFGDEHDFLIVKAEAIRKFNKLPESVKADNHL